VHPANPKPDPDEALTMARNALHLSREARLSIKVRISALNTLAAVFLSMDRPQSAYAIYRKALRILLDEDGPEKLKEEITLRFEKLAKRIKKAK